MKELKSTLIVLLKKIERMEEKGHTRNVLTNKTNEKVFAVWKVYVWHNWWGPLSQVPDHQEKQTTYVGLLSTNVLFGMKWGSKINKMKMTLSFHF